MMAKEWKWNVERVLTSGIKLIGRHVKNSVGGEVSGGKRVEISGAVSTKYCFKMGRYLENKVEGGVRKRVEMMPEKMNGNDAQRIQWEEK